MKLIGAVLIICATASIMFFLYFEKFSTLAQCQKIMEGHEKMYADEHFSSQDMATIYCIKTMGGS